MAETFSRDDYTNYTWERVNRDVLSLCTKCGECAKACPMTEPAGIADKDPVSLVDGVLAILADKPGSPEAKTWIDACSSSGSCRAACKYGVDPMFMMEMANVALKRGERTEKETQLQATRSFQNMTKSVRFLSRLFLTPEVFERLSPSRIPIARTAAPDIVFYTGCNVLRTPHIALICLDILDAIDVNYEVMGGPSHCCGAYQMNEGDLAGATGMAMNTIGKLARAAAPEVVSWCPSCKLQFGGNHLPTYAELHGKPFDFTAFYSFLERKIDRLAPLLTGSVRKRVVIDERAFDQEVNAIVKRILRMIPGLEVINADVKQVGMMRNMIPLADVKKSSRDEAFATATAVGADTLATVYHACHREVVSHSGNVSFEIVNAIELIADSMGLRYNDSYKEFQLVADIDKFIKDRMDNVLGHKISIEELRTVAFSEFAAQHPTPSPQ